MNLLHCRNKEELTIECLQRYEVVVFSCPKENFTLNEVNIINFIKYMY